MQAVITDTPGLQEGTKALNAAISKNATRALDLARDGSELVAFVVDAADIGRRLRDKKHLGLDAITRVVEHEVSRLPLQLPALITLNKSDLIRKPEHRAEIEATVMQFAKTLFRDVHGPIWLSVKSGEGIDLWLETAKSLLPMGEKNSLFDEDALTDQNLRSFAAEYIREQCFMQLGAEIPYSIAVEIAQFNEKDPALTRIEAVLHIERDSQKSIVIGTKGSKLKSIGTKSREKIERLIDKKVFLGLKVKVTPHWARESLWVERFGYGSSR